MISTIYRFRMWWVFGIIFQWLQQNFSFGPSKFEHGPCMGQTMLQKNEQISMPSVAEAFINGTIITSWCFNRILQYCRILYIARDLQCLLEGQVLRQQFLLIRFEFLLIVNLLLGYCNWTLVLRYKKVIVVIVKFFFRSWQNWAWTMHGSNHPAEAEAFIHGTIILSTSI